MPRRVNAAPFTSASATSSSHLVPLLLWLAILNLTCTGFAQHHSALQTAKQWQLFSFNFLPHAPINDPSFYNPTNVLATGIAVGYDRIFIATPQLFSGVSSTLSFVSKAEFGDSPVLQAYPDWSFSTAGRTDFNCSDLVLISVYRLRIDSCNRLWVLDAGVQRSLEDYKVACPPKILVIDLNTNQVVRRIDFPREILRGESLFTNLVIDETTSKAGNCDDVFVYISDTVEPAIVVYDSNRDVTWRLSHPSMYPDPDFAQTEILNDRFVLMDGIVGLAFDDKAGIVYFQPLATDRVFSVTKEVLRAGPIPITQPLQVRLVGKKSSQGIGLAVSPLDGSLIFSPMTETAIASWNPTTNQQTVLAHDRERLQFVADIKISEREPGVVYALSSKFHRFFLKTVNAHEYNNRILRIELPKTAGPHSIPLPSTNLGHYALGTLPSSQFGNYYQLNTLEQQTAAAAPVSQSPGYFSRSLPVTSKHPYNFQTVGVINYSARNPFTALNQGEAFPPTRANRLPSPSFLDSLAAAHAPRAGPASLPLGRGYYYDRALRSTRAEAETATPK